MCPLRRVVKLRLDLFAPPQVTQASAKFPGSNLTVPSSVGAAATTASPSGEMLNGDCCRRSTTTLSSSSDGNSDPRTASKEKEPEVGSVKSRRGEQGRNSIELLKIFLKIFLKFKY